MSMHQKYRSLVLCLAFAGSLALGSCSKSYDDSALQGRITHVEGRITQVENQLKTMNANISSLQAMVEALKSNMPISAVTPVDNNGYQLTFSGGKSITIYPDASGKVDASRPTPRFKIENDYWFVSYDNAKSWERLSRAKGEQGERGVQGLQGERGIPGERGANGHTPVIGLERGSDGSYYWTVDGSRLQTSGGTLTATTAPRFKIENNRWYISYDNGSTWLDLAQARGDKGDTPTFRIQNDYWEVSYNNGQSWTQLGRAKGDKGDRGEAGAGNTLGSVFRLVTEDSSAVHITLASGDRLSIPKVGGISINFEGSTSIVAEPNKTYTLGYSLSGQSIGAKASVQALAQDGYRVEVKKLTSSTGQIIVHTPSAILKSTIVLLVSDGVSQTITSAIAVSDGRLGVGEDSGARVLRSLSSVFALPKSGETAEMHLHTNTNYEIRIPTEAQSWIQLLSREGRALIRKETLRLKVLENNTGEVRSAILTLVDESGSIQEDIMIYQGSADTKVYYVSNPGTLEQIARSEDKATLRGLKLLGHLNGSDYDYIKSMASLLRLDLSELSATTIPEGALAYSDIESVNLPKALIAIPSRLFYGSQLSTIDIPSSVQSIGDYAFAEMNNFKGAMAMPSTLRTIGEGAFRYSRIGGTIQLNEGLLTIKNNAFADAFLSGDIVIPNSVKAIEEELFRATQLVGNIRISDGVTSIGRAAFKGFSLTGVLTMGKGLKIIASEAFVEAKLKIPNFGENIESIGSRAFQHASVHANRLILNKIKEVGRLAFFDAKLITTEDGTEPRSIVVLGESIERIGERAFEFFYPGAHLWCKSPNPPIVVGGFSGSIVIPRGTLDRYQAAEGWSQAYFEEKDF